VGSGGDRGAHNCGDCDEGVYDAVTAYSITGDAEVLERPDCGCKEKWRAVVERETAWRAPLG
jgi:hypothetical protein